MKKRKTGNSLSFELTHFFHNILKTLNARTKGGNTMKSPRLPSILEVVAVLGLFLAIVLSFTLYFKLDIQLALFISWFMVIALGIRLGHSYKDLQKCDHKRDIKWIRGCFNLNCSRCTCWYMDCWRCCTHVNLLRTGIYSS